jgi:hypothetical protein
MSVADILLVIGIYQGLIQTIVETAFHVEFHLFGFYAGKPWVQVIAALGVRNMVPSSVFSVTPVFLSFDAIEMVVTMDAVVVSMLVGPFSVALASNTVVGAPAEAVALNANTDVVAPTATLIEGMGRGYLPGLP